MNQKLTYYHVLTPEGLSMTFIGGPVLPGDDEDHVWLTTPDNKPLFRVRREHVRESSREDTVRRLLADMRAARMRSN